MITLFLGTFLADTWQQFCRRYLCRIAAKFYVISIAKKFPGDKHLRLKLRYEKAILDFALEDMKVQPTDDFMMGGGPTEEERALHEELLRKKK